MRHRLLHNMGWTATALALLLAIVVTAGGDPLLAFWSWRGAAVAFLIVASVALLLWHSRSEPGGLADSRHVTPGRTVLPSGAHSMAPTPGGVPDGNAPGLAERFLRGSTGMLLPTAPRQHPAHAPEHTRTPLRQALIPLAVALPLLLWNLVA